jgi:hypothetical protein
MSGTIQQDKGVDHAIESGSSLHDELVERFGYSEVPMNIGTGQLDYFISLLERFPEVATIIDGLTRGQTVILDLRTNYPHFTCYRTM